MTGGPSPSRSSKAALALFAKALIFGMLSGNAHPKTLPAEQEVSIRSLQPP
jgi:hypothetical protein